MQLEQIRARIAGVGAGVTVQVGQRGPVVGAGRCAPRRTCSPTSARCRAYPERQRAAAGRDVDRAREPLVGEVAALRERELAAGAGPAGLGEQIGVDGVPVADAVARGRRAGRTGRSPPSARYDAIGSRGVPRPSRPAAPRAPAFEHAVRDRLQAGGHGDRNVYAALSRGWSLTGNQVGARAARRRPGRRRRCG